jgi:chitin synthase
LGGVTAVKDKDGKTVVKVEIPTDRKDINANYELFVSELQKARPQEKGGRDAKTKQEDYFRNFRTYTVLFWFFSNALIIVALTNSMISKFLYQELGLDTGANFNPYLRFIFYSVAAISAVRFVGSMTYLILYAFCR